MSESRLVLSRCHTVGNHMSLLNFMDKLTDRYQIFESGHIHTVIKFHQYSPISVIKLYDKHKICIYSETCLKQPLENRQSHVGP